MSIESGNLLKGDVNAHIDKGLSDLLLDEVEVGLLLLPVRQVVHQAGHLVQQALRSHLNLGFIPSGSPKFTCAITLIGITRAYLENVVM